MVTESYIIGYKKGYDDCKNGLTWDKNPFKLSTPIEINIEKEKGWYRGFEKFIENQEEESK